MRLYSLIRREVRFGMQWLTFLVGEMFGARFRVDTLDEFRGISSDKIDRMGLWLINSAYLAVLVAGLIMSFAAGRGRFLIRVATGVVSIPLWLVLALAAFLWEQQPPSLEELQRDFASKRSDLETILQMSDEDANFSRIAPDFLDQLSDGPSDAGRFSAGDTQVRLSSTRWDAYRRVYQRNGIKLGIQRDSAHDAFIMMDSIGLLNDGHTTGYVHCAPPVLDDANRFFPCRTNHERGQQRYDPDKRLEEYSFQRLDDRWFAYDDGPS